MAKATWGTSKKWLLIKDRLCSLLKSSAKNEPCPTNAWKFWRKSRPRPSSGLHRLQASGRRRLPALSKPAPRRIKVIKVLFALLRVVGLCQNVTLSVLSYIHPETPKTDNVNGEEYDFLKHFHLEEHSKQWRTPQTAHQFDHPFARKSRLKSLVTSQLIRYWYELWCHRQIQRQFFTDRMIVSMCGLWGSSLFSELFLITVFLTVFKISYSSP